MPPLDAYTCTHCSTRAHAPAACRSGCTEVVRSLLDRAIPVDMPSGLQLTPLHMACQGDHAALVALLLQRGANPLAPDEVGTIPGQLTKSDEIMTTLDAAVAARTAR
jgi:ankyrin repeat protein